MPATPRLVDLDLQRLARGDGRKGFLRDVVKNISFIKADKYKWNFPAADDEEAGVGRLPATLWIGNRAIENYERALLALARRTHGGAAFDAEHVVEVK